MPQQIDPFTGAHVPASRFVVTVPGRVNLIGEYTDFNDGMVLPMAIERSIQIAVTPRSDRLAVFQTTVGSDAATFDLRQPIMAGRGDWACYPAGVLAGYQRLGWEVPGFNASISSTLPLGGGLSSSAALEVATATLVETISGRLLPLVEKALLCQRAEHEFAGVPCGIMDQFAVTFARAGHALLLDCRSRSIRHIPMVGEEVVVLVVNSGVKHNLAGSAYPLRRSQCESAAKLLGVSSLREALDGEWSTQLPVLPLVERKRALHVLSEHGRTLAFVAALERADWLSAGAAMYESHASLRDDFEVSCAELDALVEIARSTEGVFGCRMTGGGFGGCVVGLIDTVRSSQIMAAFRHAYLARTGIDASMFVTRAAEGPRVTPLV